MAFFNKEKKIFFEINKEKKLYNFVF